jgi:phosphohistidine phosphatase SixA
MSAISVESGAANTAAFGGLIDAVGGIGAIVLAIIGLTGFDPEGMAAIATIVVGAAFLIQAGAILSEYAHIVLQAVTGSLSSEDLSDGLAAMLLVGVGGIVLGVLALLGIQSAVLTAVAVIAYGGALVLSSSSVRALYVLRGQRAQLVARSGHELLAGQMASGSAGVQLLTGLGAVVLGILAVAGHNPHVLSLAALLLLGVTVLLTGSALSSLVVSFMRTTPSSESMRVRG